MGFNEDKYCTRCDCGNSSECKNCEICIEWRNQAQQEMNQEWYDYLHR